MTTIEIEGRYYRPESSLRRWSRVLRARLGEAGGVAAVTVARSAGRVAKSAATPAVSHIREHLYSILGFCFFDAAMFTHSLFTGLLVTGISWFVFEWKVSPEGEDDTSKR